jgi:hypothetical protein
MLAQCPGDQLIVGEGPRQPPPIWTTTEKTRTHRARGDVLPTPLAKLAPSVLQMAGSLSVLSNRPTRPAAGFGS